MMTLYFVNPDARHHTITVSAVNDGQALEYGQAVEVSNELGKQLLKNEGDWSETAPRGTSGNTRRRKAEPTADAEQPESDSVGKEAENE